MKDILNISESLIDKVPKIAFISAVCGGKLMDLHCGMLRMSFQERKCT